MVPEKGQIGKFPFNTLTLLEHIPERVDTIPADVFSRLLPQTRLIVNYSILSQCTIRQHNLIKTCYVHHYVHSGVKITLGLLKSNNPEETPKDLWPTYLQDVRDFKRC